MIELDDSTDDTNVVSPEGTDDLPVSKDVADAEFARFAEAMDLDLDPASMFDDEERSGFFAEKRRVVTALRRGHLRIDAKGQPTFSPQVSPGGDITFREPDGLVLMEMDKAKRGQSMRASNLVMAGMTKMPPARFAKMKGRDLKVCQAIANLFLAG